METYYIIIFSAAVLIIITMSTTGTSTERTWLTLYFMRIFFFNLLTRKVYFFFLNWKAIVWKTFVEHIVFAVQDIIICAQSARAFIAHLQYSPNRIIIISTIVRVYIDMKLFLFFHRVWFECKLSLSTPLTLHSPHRGYISDQIMALWTRSYFV